MSKTEISRIMLAAWIQYHKDALPLQIEAAKKRIARILEA